MRNIDRSLIRYKDFARSWTSDRFRQVQSDEELSTYFTKTEVHFHPFIDTSLRILLMPNPHYKKLIEHIWWRVMLLAYNSTWSLRCLYLNIRWCSLAPSQLISCASIACVLDVRCISFNYCLINMDAFQVFVLVQELQQCRHDDGLVWIISIPIKCNDSVKNTGACTLTHTHRLPCKYCQYVWKKCRNLNGSTELNV